MTSVAEATLTSPVRPPVVGLRRTIALFAILMGLLLDLLDIVIVNVALPTIQSDFGASGAHMQWMVGAYTLAFAAMLVTGGRLGDIFGRRRIFIIGAVGFAVASLVAGLAQAPEQLILARFIQGGMGAVMVPQVLSILQVMYPPADRGRAFSALSVVFAVGTVGGPIVGALLTSSGIAGLTWRTIFLVNVPIVVACLVITLLLVPESKADNANRLDLPAVLLVGGAMLLLVFPLVQGRDLGWPSWVFVSLAASVAMFIALFVYQRQRTDSPLIPMTLFHHRSFRGGLAVSLFFMAGVMPFFLINTLYLQIGQGYTVIEAGIAGIVWGFAVPLFTAISASRITPKLGRLGLQLGLLMLIASMAVLIVTVHAVDEINTLVLIPGLMIGGAGMGMTFAPLLTYTLYDVPLNDAGSASGMFNSVQQMGAAIGIALSGMVFFTVLNVQAQDVARDLTMQLRPQLTTIGVSESAAERVLADASTCFTQRMRVSNPIADLPICRTVAAGSGLSGNAAQEAVAVTAQQQAIASRVAFQRTTEQALLFQIVLFSIALLASALLPRRVQQN